MLLIKGCIVYHGVFVDGVFVFDRFGQPSEFAVWKINKLFNKFSRVTVVLYIYFLVNLDSSPFYLAMVQSQCLKVIGRNCALSNGSWLSML